MTQLSDATPQTNLKTTFQAQPPSICIIFSITNIKKYDQIIKSRVLKSLIKFDLFIIIANYHNF